MVATPQRAQAVKAADDIKKNPNPQRVRTNIPEGNKSFVKEKAVLTQGPQQQRSGHYGHWHFCQSQKGLHKRQAHQAWALERHRAGSRLAELASEASIPKGQAHQEQVTARHILKAERPGQQATICAPRGGFNRAKEMRAKTSIVLHEGS